MTMAHRPPHRRTAALRHRVVALALFAAAGIVLAGLASDRLGAEGTRVAVLDVKGAIGPATTDYLVRGIEDAAEAGDEAVVIRIDTPGGLDAATRDINQAILAAPLPVITWVHPEGARAASAGTYILYASHVAAMTSATNLGAATPVQIMGGPGGGSGDESPKRDPGNDDAQSEADSGANGNAADDGPAPADAMSRKAINDSVAYIRGLAEKRGRNADWAEAAVRRAESFTASAALEQNVVDLIAETLDDLLEQLDGREIELRDATVTLTTAGAATRTIEPDWRNRILARITDPTVAYLLFLIGLYGLLLEGYNPGVLVPGVIGAICLVLALYAFQVLPINYAGVLLILLGIALMVAEAFAPSFGVLGIGGIVALVFGSVILIDPAMPGVVVSRGVIGGIAGLSAIAFLGLSVFLVRSRRRPLASGEALIVGQLTEVIDAAGRVHLQGEDWQTRSPDDLRTGDRVEVVGIDGLHLEVRKLTKQDTKQGD